MEGWILDKDVMELAKALSLSELDQPASRESKIQRETAVDVKAQFKKDENIDGSPVEDEAEDVEQNAKSIQVNLSVDRNDAPKNIGENPAEDEANDDKQLAKAILVSLSLDSNDVLENVGESPVEDETEDDKQLAEAILVSLSVDSDDVLENIGGNPAEYETNDDKQLAEAILVSLSVDSNDVLENIGEHPTEDETDDDMQLAMAILVSLSLDSNDLLENVRENPAQDEAESYKQLAEAVLVSLNVDSNDGLENISENPVEDGKQLAEAILVSLNVDSNDVLKNIVKNPREDQAGNSKQLKSIGEHTFQVSLGVDSDDVLKSIGEHPAEDEAENDEQLAKAIQVSLSLESNDVLENIVENPAEDQAEDDEQLAKAIQVSWSLDSNDVLENTGKNPAEDQVEDDEQLAEAIQISWSLDSNDVLENIGENPAEDQVKDDEELDKAIQVSLSLDSNDVLKNIGKDPAEDQAADDKQVAGATEESFNITTLPCNLAGDGCLSGENLMEVDEQLAKAVQESLNMESPSRKCAGCKRSIQFGTCVSRMASFWHHECSKCHSCNKATTDDDELSKSKRRLYHKACYKMRCSRICFVCKDPLPLDAAGRTPYCKHHFWGQKYCPSHDTDRTATCCSCEKMEQKDVEYLKLDDGRKLCLECLESGTMDTIEGQSVYFDVREFFEGLHMKIEQIFPLYLVEKQALNRARVEEQLGNRDVVQTRGLCLSEEQTVVSVLKGPRSAGDEVVKETVRLVRKCDVTAILILYGLPRLLTGSILAHELMHAWLRLNGYRNLKPYVEEGICQVLAHRWLESETFAADDPASASSSSASSSSPADTSKKGKQPDFEKKLVELFKKQIEMDPSPDYGDGFRKAIKAVANTGLKETLKYIKANNDFP